MKKLTKLASLLLALAMAVSLTACSGGGTSSSSGGGSSTASETEGNSSTAEEGGTATTASFEVATVRWTDACPPISWRPAL